MERTLQSVFVCVLVIAGVAADVDTYEDEEDYVPVHVYRIVDDPEPASASASASDYQTVLRPPFLEPDLSETMLYARPDRYGGFKYTRRPQRLVRVNPRPVPKPRPYTKPHSRPQPQLHNDQAPFILRIHKYRYNDDRR